MYTQKYTRLKVNTFKYHVLCTDGKISVRNIYFYYLLFHHRPTHKLCLLYRRPFVINATRPVEKAYRNENTNCEWDEGGKIGNKNKQGLKYPDNIFLNALSALSLDCLL